METKTEPHKTDNSVAILGADFPDLRIKAEVRAGDRVAAGQILFRDAKRREIAFVSPISGRVTSIEFASRRMLRAFVIDAEDGELPVGCAPPVGDVRAILLERGMWPALIRRPFGGPPDPNAVPACIIVSFVRADRSSPDSQDFSDARWDDILRGLAALEDLSGGSVHLCLEHGMNMPFPQGLYLHHRRRSKSWSMPSGQVARIHPPAPDEEVWTIGYQDVAAIGHLLNTGIFDANRTVALRRMSSAAIRIVEAPLGANLTQLFNDDASGLHDRTLVSGSIGSSRPSVYLGRHHLDAGLQPMMHRTPCAHPMPLIPLTSLMRALPTRTPVVPLMHALSIGDTQTCAKLGCLDLLEEDVATLTAACTSGVDYGQCLRRVLQDLRQEAA